MRHLRSALLLALAVGLALGTAAAPAAAGASAGTTRRTLTIATEDVTHNGWDGIYVQRYVIDVAASGKFTGRGQYVGFIPTTDEAGVGADVACGLTQSIKGNVGSKARFVAQYDSPEQAYWYDFQGRIDGTTVEGRGTNVNGQRFVVTTATLAQVAAAEAGCEPAA